MLGKIKQKLKSRLQRAAWAGPEAQRSVAELRGHIFQLWEELKKRDAAHESVVAEHEARLAELEARLAETRGSLENRHELLPEMLPELLGDALPDAVRAVLPDELLNQPAIGSLLYPMDRPSDGYIVEMKPEGVVPASDGLPLPPPFLREGYGQRPDGTFDDEVYLRSGSAMIGRLEKILGDHDFSLERPIRVLDFGGSTGRMARHFAKRVRTEEGGEVWVVDVSSPNIAWAQTHLSPPINFAVTTTAPHLPFPDGYFDLIFASSVFTHIAELTDAWLLELKRITKPGGLNALTFFDQTSLETVKTGFEGNKAWPFIREFDKETSVLSKPYAYFVYKSSPKLTRIAYNNAFLRDKLSGIFDFRDAVHGGAFGWQTVYVLRRPEGSGRACHASLASADTLTI